MNDKYYFGLTNQYNLLPSYSSPSKDEKCYKFASSNNKCPKTQNAGYEWKDTINLCILHIFDIHEIYGMGIFL
jgi:hypothetical protein